MVREVKCFRGELQGSFLAQFEGAAEAQIEVVIVGTTSAIARRARRAVVGEMTITIDVRAGEEIKGMAAVVVKDGRKLEPPRMREFSHGRSNTPARTTLCPWSKSDTDRSHLRHVALNGE